MRQKITGLLLFTFLPGYQKARVAFTTATAEFTIYQAAYYTIAPNLTTTRQNLWQLNCWTRINITG
ncbi:hypothetical protein PR003_g33356 [Phytophthora rubi]|uniref:Uncharacterized protein n=1 Tax=Phytophthora rubi TaxID=129364 RepID=A0A6A3GBH0_9STRA|nr:hypothetical protein PR001_g32320 [Phytophthora rubi]KAE9262918.1 hypothetical protein PR003_g33356 [Phytophthora rubi]